MNCTHAATEVADACIEDCPICQRAETERLRSALELIAGSTTDKLQAMQARNALDNIGAAYQQQGDKE